MDARSRRTESRSRRNGGRLELSPAIKTVLDAPPCDQVFHTAGTVWKRQEASGSVVAALAVESAN